MSKKCSTAQRFIRTEKTTYRIGTLDAYAVLCPTGTKNLEWYLTSSSGKGFGIQTRNLEICALLQILGKRVGKTGQVTVLVRF